MLEQDHHNGSSSFTYLPTLMRMLRLEDAFNALRSFSGLELKPLSSAKIKELKAKIGITDEVIAANVKFPELRNAILLKIDQNDSITINSILISPLTAAAVDVTVLGTLSGTYGAESQCSLGAHPSIMIKNLGALLSSTEQAQNGSEICVNKNCL